MVAVETAPWAGVLGLGAVFAILGVALIELGRRGKARRVDYVFGGYTRENCGEVAFDEAHVKVGQAMIIAGILYLIATVLIVFNRSGNWVAGVTIAAAIVTTGLLLLAVIKAVKNLGLAYAAQRS